MRRHIGLVVAALMGVAALGFAPGPSVSAQQPPLVQRVDDAPDSDPRPNIVLVMTDDMAASDLRAIPRVRRLIGGPSGTAFHNSFSPFPLCCPARATILTGQYAHNHRVLGNGSGGFPEGGFGGFPTDDNTVATWLDDAGYQTALVGKYLNNYGAPCCPARVPPGWDEWHGLLGGSYRSVQAFEDGVVQSYPHSYRSTWTTETAVDVIDERVAYGGPLMLFTWYFAPHFGKPIEPDDPIVALDRNINTPVPSRADKDYYLGTPAPRSPSFNEADVSDKPAPIAGRAAFDATDELALDELYQQRLETLRSVGRGVARMLGALRRSGELDNTVFVFTSDNGYLLGQHRVMQGKVFPYEEALRVPLLIRGPGFPGTTKVTQLVGGQDLAATFVDLADATPGRVLDGVPLTTVAADPTAYAGRDIVIEAGPRRRAGEMWFTGLRTERYTYVEYASGERELYDLRADRYQLQNMIGDPTTDPALEQRLVDQLAAMRNCAGEACLVDTTD